MSGTAVDADAPAHPPTTPIPHSTAMSGTVGDALLASGADNVPKVSDSDGSEHLAGSVGFQDRATNPDRLPCLLASADATFSDQVEATESGRPRRLLASVEVTPPEFSDPDGLEHLVGTVGFQVDSITESYHLLAASELKTNLTICQDGSQSSLGDTLMFPDMVRSQLGSSEDQHLGLYVLMSCGTVIHMDERNCYAWNFCTGESLMLLPLVDLLNPFPPLHSSIVQATASWPLRTLVRYDEWTWYCQRQRDWPGLPDSVLQEILSDIDCTRDFHAFAYTCKSWYLASSLYPRPLLLYPRACPTWLFVTPGGRFNSTIGNLCLFPALRMKEQSTLIGGSTKFLIFVDESVCHIMNIHTGKSTELLVPCLGVQRGVLSAPGDSANSMILLVTGTSVLCKSVHGTDQWRVQDFGNIRVGRIDDIVFVGETAYLINKRSRLFIISPALEISFWDLADLEVPPPTEPWEHDFAVGEESVHKNWLLEHSGELLRLFLMSYTRGTEVHSGFFMSRIGPHDMYQWLTNKLHGRKWPAEAWVGMESADLGDACVFLNMGNSVASFVADRPGRWGLKGGQVFTCGPKRFPWLSFDLGWVKDDVIPKNIRWPCPVFMDSGFSFTAAEELDHRMLRDKAPEPTALNVDLPASSSRTLPSEARELSFNEEAN